MTLLGSEIFVEVVASDGEQIASKNSVKRENNIASGGMCIVKMFNSKVLCNYHLYITVFCMYKIIPFLKVMTRYLEKTGIRNSINSLILHANVFPYNTLNSTLSYYFDIRQAISQ